MLDPFASDQGAAVAVLVVVAAAWFLAGPIAWRLACRRAGWLDRPLGAGRRERGSRTVTRQERWSFAVHVTTSALIMLGGWAALIVMLAP